MFGKLIAQHIERDRLMERLRSANAQLAVSALTDPVTGLANRRAIFDEGSRMVARSIRDSSALVVAFIDLDGFKKINDLFGHDVGDQLLVEVGNRIVSSSRAGDVVARFGGDEFVVVAPVSFDCLESATAVLGARLESCTRGVYRLNDQTVHFSGGSVGIVGSHASDASIEILIRLADANMYRRKQERRAAGET